MEYVCVNSRFLFFDGKNRYTVEYSYGIEKWFVFNNIDLSDSVYVKADKKIKVDNVNSSSAEDILIEYLQK
jgi:hypothetical protein